MQESGENFAARHEQADALAAALNHTRSLIDQMTDDSNTKLVASLLRVRETTRQAAESSRRVLDEELAHVADRLTEQNRIALSQAVEAQIETINSAMQSAIQHNLALSEASTKKLTGQLAQLDEMAANLEQRLTEGRDSFEGLDDDSFARRMVLLTESLNSTAIDVAKIMSNDVTDTAWASYLKGDRGVFTRRAVRLLDAGEVRIIAAHYADDAEFREHVNRYIHDFEAMMRVLLSTRDGNAIGVTLLSSDVGKLYVALAQAIERLRA
jgi:exonuclease VII large subunit